MLYVYLCTYRPRKATAAICMYMCVCVDAAQRYIVLRPTDEGQRSRNVGACVHVRQCYS